MKPATSSSVVVTETVWLATESKLLSELPSLTATVIVEVIVPSTRSSFAPVTVTVLGVFQFSGVKVNGVFTVASPVSEEETTKTTLESGCAFNTKVNVSVVPDSATLVDPLDSAIVNPATSLSVVATATVWLATESKLLSDAASTMDAVMVLFTVPSMRLSSTPVTVTVCGVFQLPEVKVSGLLTVASPVSPEANCKTTSEFG